MPRRKKDKTNATPAEDTPKIFDRRLMEQTIADVHALLEGQDFDSIEEMNAYLQHIVRDGPPPSVRPTETPLQRAQEVMYQAFEAEGAERIALARQALTISADCADAYVLLAEEAADDLAEAHAWYAQGVEAGRRALGPQIFEEDKGHFWGLLETRPFMRALAGYAFTLWALGRLQESLTQQRLLLELNPNDNQGNRGFLAHSLLVTGHLDELERLLAQYELDDSADMNYARALAAFAAAGAGNLAQRRLDRALDANPFVPNFLLDEWPLPAQLPDYYGDGDVNEAIYYVVHFGSGWSHIPGALAWLESAWQTSPAGAEAQQRISDQQAAWDDDDAAWDDEEFAIDSDYPPFELEAFLAAGGFPKSEHAAIRRALAAGLKNFFIDFDVFAPGGMHPDRLIDDYMHMPFVFGYGAVELLQHKKLRPLSKDAICKWALASVEMDQEYGVPYGVLAIVAWLAGRGELSYAQVIGAVIALEFGARIGFSRPDWYAGCSKDSVFSLSVWLAAQPIPAEEKLWWAWRLSVAGENAPHSGKAVANAWLDADDLSAEHKRTLCRAWLDGHDPVGMPPPPWRFYEALTEQDFAALRALVSAYDLPLPPDFMEHLDAIEAAHAAEVASQTPEQALWRQLRARWIMTPGYLHRLAIPCLVALGDDLQAVADEYWEGKGQYSAGMFTAGVADAVEAYGDRLPAEQRRALVERGINHTLAGTRKLFYALSERFYGDDYLRRALNDDAGSVRQWAAKKLAKK